MSIFGTVAYSKSELYKLYSLLACIKFLEKRFRKKDTLKKSKSRDNRLLKSDLSRVFWIFALFGISIANGTFFLIFFLTFFFFFIH